MFLRLWLAQLAAPEARKAARRWLLGATLSGIALTLLVLATLEMLAERWFIAAIAWIILVYLPLQILLEAAGSWGSQLKRSLVEEVRKRADRYHSPGSLPLLVEWLFERDILMPRIATPEISEKAKTAAVRILRRAVQTENPPETLHRAAALCAGVVNRWTEHLALEVSVAPGAAQSIQATWSGTRALAALAALAGVLIGAYEDMTRKKFTLSDLDGEQTRTFLNDCMDYCDQVAFHLEGPPWEPPLPLQRATEALREETALALTAAWQEYMAKTGPPSQRSLEQFVQTLMG
ncbi:MAG: hypothetical protein QN198_03290 [Armatimonadota bacterium]|nr:hypothetical protein [Armatimonadota bacterium]